MQVVICEDLFLLRDGLTRMLQAHGLEGPIEFLSEKEGRGSSAANRGTLERPWELWKKRALARK